MKTTKYEERKDWMVARLARITGSRLKNLILKRGSEPKIGYYELIAERIALPDDDTETGRDRGSRLEKTAIERFTLETGIVVNTDLVIWERDDNSRIAISPDGFTEDNAEAIIIGSTGSREAVEVKCMNSAEHIKSYLTKKIPDQYEEQVIQYFIVNDKLERLYFVMYDDRMSVADFFYITITRESVTDKIDEYLAQEYNVLARVEASVISLTSELF